MSESLTLRIILSRMLAAGLPLPLLTRFLCSKGDTPLIVAAKQRDLNMARLLVSAGADVNLRVFWREHLE